MTKIPFLRIKVTGVYFRSYIMCVNGYIFGYTDITIVQSLKLFFCDFPWVLKKTFLCLMLKHQCGNVESWLESWNGHFTNSHTPRFSAKHVLFYLVKRQNCCFEWSNLKPFSLAGARLMARMAQLALEIYLRTWNSHHEKLYNKCSNL